MEELANQKGSVDDIRSHLRLLKPQTLQEAGDLLDYLNRSWDDEIRNRGRRSVLALLDAKTNEVYRLLKRMTHGKG